MPDSLPALLLSVKRNQPEPAESTPDAAVNGTPVVFTTPELYSCMFQLGAPAFLKHWDTGVKPVAQAGMIGKPKPQTSTITSHSAVILS